MNYISKLKKYNNKLRYSQSGGANLGVNIGNKGIDVIVMCAQNGFSNEVLPFIHLDRSFNVDAQLWGAMKNVKNSRGKTHLMHACAIGNMPKVNFLLSLGADITLVDNLYKTLLMYATQYGHLDIVDRLLTLGADIMLGDVHNRTVLMYAAENGRLHILNRLLEQFNHLNGADRLFAINKYVNQRDGFHYSALVFACRFGYLDIVNRLIDMSATVKPDQNILSLEMAVRYNHLAIVSRLLATRSFNQIDLNFVLIDACEKNHNNIINLLLDPPNNARPTAQIHRPREDGLTALMAATRNNNFTIVNRLLEYGADVNADDHYRHIGNTALTIAIQNNNLDIVNRLIDKGAHVNFWNDSAQATPLYLAFRYGASNGIIQRLLASGANPNGPYNGLSIPMLMYTCMFLDDHQPNPVVLGRIIDYFGLAGIVEFDGQRTTPLIIATELGKEHFVNLLLNRGASIDDVDDKGHNAFWYARKNLEEYSEIGIERATRIYDLLQ
jgi:ankyrin repeat protein